MYMNNAIGFYSIPSKQIIARTMDAGCWQRYIHACCLVSLAFNDKHRSFLDHKQHHCTYGALLASTVHLSRAALKSASDMAAMVAFGSVNGDMRAPSRTLRSMCSAACGLNCGTM